MVWGIGVKFGTDARARDGGHDTRRTDLSD